eukprot:gene15730-21294_t
MGGTNSLVAEDSSNNSPNNHHVENHTTKSGIPKLREVFMQNDIRKQSLVDYIEQKEWLNRLIIKNEIENSQIIQNEELLEGGFRRNNNDASDSYDIDEDMLSEQLKNCRGYNNRPINDYKHFVGEFKGYSLPRNRCIFIEKSFFDPPPSTIFGINSISNILRRFRINHNIGTLKENIENMIGFELTDETFNSISLSMIISCFLEDEYKQEQKLSLQTNIIYDYMIKIDRSYDSDDDNESKGSSCIYHSYKSHSLNSPFQSPLSSPLPPYVTSPGSSCSSSSQSSIGYDNNNNNNNSKCCYSPPLRKKYNNNHNIKNSKSNGTFSPSYNEYKECISDLSSHENSNSFFNSDRVSSHYTSSEFDSSLHHSSVHSSINSSVHSSINSSIHSSSLNSSSHDLSPSSSLDHMFSQCILYKSKNEWQELIGNGNWAYQLASFIENCPYAISVSHSKPISLPSISIVEYKQLSRKMRRFYALPYFPLVFTNNMFEELTLYSKEEDMSNQSFFWMQPHYKSEQQQISLLTNALTYGKATKVAMTAKRKNGSEFLDFMALRPVYNVKGEYSFMICIHYDIQQESSSYKQFGEIDHLLTILTSMLRIQ